MGANNEVLAMQEIYNHFPIGDLVEFRVETDIGDVIADAYVEKLEMNQFAKIVNAVISLYLPKPWWESNTQYFENFTTGGNSALYNGIVPAGGLITVSYTGTHGSDITLSNSMGSQSMTIDYTPLISLGVTPPVANDKIEIDTRDGQKSIRFWDDSSSKWHNIMQCLTVNDDWIKLTYGTNVLSYSCSISSDEADMIAQISYRENYQGV